MITITDENRERILEEWAESLETTNIKQAQHYLCLVDENGQKRQCCLGVLYDVLNPDGWHEFEYQDDNDKGYRIMKQTDGSYQWIDWEIERDLQIDGTYFARLNDNERRTFKEIAEAIRKGEGRT